MPPNHKSLITSHKIKLKMKKLIVILPLIMLLCVPAKAQSSKEVVDGIVAVVGKTIVKNSDIEQAYAQVRLRQGVQNAQNERCTLLESMLMTKLLVHKGMIDSVEVSDEQVEAEVDRYLKQIVKQLGSKEALRNMYGVSYDELHDQYFDILHDRAISQKVEYELTELGLSLREPIDQLRTWAERNVAHIVRNREAHDGDVPSTDTTMG